MVNYVTLLGAEDVSRAGRSMASAASEIQRAAVNIEGALQRFERFLDDWLFRLQDVLEKAPK